MKKYTEMDVYNHLYCKIFNTDVYEIFPELENCIKEDYIATTGFLEDFLIDLFDLSKPVVKPFIDERSTYAYRSFYGINNFGIAVPLTSIGEQVSLSGARIGQIIKAADIALINMIISEYKSYKNNQDVTNVPIEELGFSRKIYNKLKRCGVNTLNEIDFSYLRKLEGFGEKTLDDIGKGMVRLKK